MIRRNFVPTCIVCCLCLFVEISAGSNKRSTNLPLRVPSLEDPSVNCSHIVATIDSSCRNTHCSLLSTLLDQLTFLAHFHWCLFLVGAHESLSRFASLCSQERADCCARTPKHCYKQAGLHRLYTPHLYIGSLAIPTPKPPNLANKYHGLRSK